MPVIAKATADTPRELAPSGLLQAVCAFVEDVGLQKTEYKGETKIQHKVIVIWEIDEKEAAMEDGRRFMISKRYTLSLSDKANLRKDLETWRGKKFSTEELEGFDVENLIGANCLLNVIHAESGGKTYANINGVMPLKSGMTKIKPVNTEVPKWVSEVRAKAVQPDNTPPQAPPPHDLDNLPF